MNNVPSIAVAAVLCFAPCALADPSPILPVTPASIFQYLPPTPEGWTLTKSEALTQQGLWVTTKASRNYERKITPDGRVVDEPTIDVELAEGDAAQQAPPELITQRIQVELFDSGYHPSIIARFDDLSSVNTPTYKRGKIDDRPTILSYEETKVRIQTLIAGRFLLLINTENVDRDEAYAWIDSADLAGMKSLPNTGQTEMPLQVPLVVINELNPSLSSTRTASGTTNAAARAAAERTILQQLANGSLSTTEAAEERAMLEGQSRPTPSAESAE